MSTKEQHVAMSRLLLHDWPDERTVRSGAMMEEVALAMEIQLVIIVKRARMRVETKQSGFLSGT